jgi:hypothetical protein
MHIFGAIFIILLFPSLGHAYLDPGSGSYFFQIIMGALLGAMYVLKLYWLKIRDYCIFLSRPKKTHAAETKNPR